MAKEMWYRYTLSEQMSNIGDEVKHFIDSRAKFARGETEQDYSEFYYNKAIEYINIIEEDPKNIHRKPELEDCKQELQLLKAGIYSEKYIMDYWDQYTAACAFRAQQLNHPAGIEKPQY